ncbi:MAG TPA: hypothetical protein VHE99_01615 [Gammaproteobacteria bacterium]|nr:hypothetical protein [Gammaproteobacteria bacterium]HWA25719.1 hypothetical protein [Lacunisphaera sp.]
MSTKPAPFIELKTPSTLKRYSDEERQNHCENWKKSGLSMSKYCRQVGLPISSLSKWLSDNNNRVIEKNTQEPASMATIQSQVGMEIILVSGIRLRLSRVTISEMLRFVKALES